MDKRFKFYQSVRESVYDKLQNEREPNTDMIQYVLNELKGCEKLFGLRFIFTELNNNMEEEEKNLINDSTALIIGDMVDQEDNFINETIDVVIDTFYSFDKLKDGFLVGHDFDEIKNYLDTRLNTGQINYN